MIVQRTSLAHLEAEQPKWQQSSRLCVSSFGLLHRIGVDCVFFLWPTSAIAPEGKSNEAAKGQVVSVGFPDWCLPDSRLRMLWGTSLAGKAAGLAGSRYGQGVGFMSIYCGESDPESADEPS
jgi:hypothetical protein